MDEAPYTPQLKNIGNVTPRRVDDALFIHHNRKTSVWMKCLLQGQSVARI
jgi:hypothetical protein